MQQRHRESSHNPSRTCAATGIDPKGTPRLGSRETCCLYEPPGDTKSGQNTRIRPKLRQRRFRTGRGKAGRSVRIAEFAPNCFRTRSGKPGRSRDSFKSAFKKWLARATSGASPDCCLLIISSSSRLPVCLGDETLRRQPAPEVAKLRKNRWVANRPSGPYESNGHPLLP